MKKAEYILGIVVFVVCGLTIFFIQDHHRKTEDALRAEWRKDEQEARNVIAEKDAEILALSKRQKEIAEKMTRDSIRYSDAYNAFKIENARLTKKINEISYKNFDTRKLDSVRHALYGGTGSRGSLH